MIKGTRLSPPSPLYHGNMINQTTESTEPSKPCELTKPVKPIELIDMGQKAKSRHQNLRYSDSRSLVLGEKENMEIVGDKVDDHEAEGTKATSDGDSENLPTDKAMLEVADEFVDKTELMAILGKKKKQGREAEGEKPKKRVGSREVDLLMSAAMFMKEFRGATEAQNETLGIQVLGQYALNRTEKCQDTSNNSSRSSSKESKSFGDRPALLRK
ncbi:hypothetical protein BGZ76_005278 [Entomortierella beljakovae]|nr:hypothetical protein BGZ76_005278 [Entomortierella beljakovae]